MSRRKQYAASFSVLRGVSLEAGLRRMLEGEGMKRAILTGERDSARKEVAELRRSLECERARCLRLERENAALSVELVLLGGPGEVSLGTDDTPGPGPQGVTSGDSSLEAPAGGMGRGKGPLE